jgi:hypothetical protein
MEFTTKLRTPDTALTSTTKTTGSRMDPLASKFR